MFKLLTGMTALEASTALSAITSALYSTLPCFNMLAALEYSQVNSGIFHQLAAIYKMNSSDPGTYKPITSSRFPEEESETSSSTAAMWESSPLPSTSSLEAPGRRVGALKLGATQV